MANASQIRKIGSRIELFVDDWLVDRFAGTSLRMHHPVPRGAALKFNQAWEGDITHFVTILEADGAYRAYYYSGKQETNQSDWITGVATSPDGITWERPTLGLIDRDGSRDNNVIILGDVTETFEPFLDLKPGIPAAERFKAVAAVHVPGANRNPRWPVLVPYVSADGYRWRKLREEPIIVDGSFDSQNIAYWDAYRGHYVAFYRDFWDEDGARIRAVKTATSPNFLDWTAGEWWDYGNKPIEQFYTNATIVYPRAPHMYLSFPMRFVPERTPFPEHRVTGISDAVFLSSRDGVHWDRTFMEAFIRPTLEWETWTDRTTGPAWGILQTSSTELSIYWIDHYRHPSVRLTRGTLRLDGFASLYAGYAGGEMISQPLTFGGRQLVLNYETSAVGGIQIEIQSIDGRPIPGYTLADSVTLYGNRIAEAFRWGERTDVHDLAGTPIRLRVVLRDADVYSLRFQD